MNVCTFLYYQETYSLMMKTSEIQTQNGCDITLELLVRQVVPNSLVERFLKLTYFGLIYIIVVISLTIIIFMIENTARFKAYYSYVQEPALFSCSIADNIRYGAPDPKAVTMEMVEAAANQAFADMFISNFPQKYDTMVGERGLMLSGKAVDIN